MKPLAALLLGVLLASAACLAEPDPRKQMMMDPLPRTLGDRGVLLAAGPEYLRVTRDYFLYDTVERTAEGPMTRLYGFGFALSRDIPDARGRDHLAPFISASFMPDQPAFLDDPTGIIIPCNYYQFQLGVQVGRSALPKAVVRPYFLAGPTLNLLLWQKRTVVQRLAWGAAARSGVLFKGFGRKWIVELNYSLSALFSGYPDAYMDVREYIHTVGLRAGPAF
ncbi:MAG: hypothetical protein V1913_14810 [Fibrobacterota bacterium]